MKFSFALGHHRNGASSCQRGAGRGGLLLLLAESFGKESFIGDDLWLKEDMAWPKPLKCLYSVVSIVIQKAIKAF